MGVWVCAWLWRGVLHEPDKVHSLPQHETVQLCVPSVRAQTPAQQQHQPTCSASLEPQPRSSTTFPGALPCTTRSALAGCASSTCRMHSDSSFTTAAVCAASGVSSSGTARCQEVAGVEEEGGGQPGRQGQQQQQQESVSAPGSVWRGWGKPFASLALLHSLSAPCAAAG